MVEQTFGANGIPERLRRRPRRILFVHYGDAWIRGSERVLLDILAHLDKTRFTPMLWCNSETVAIAARDQGIAVRRGEFRSYLLPDSPRFSWRAYRDLIAESRALITKNGIDLVHANSAAPTQFMLPAARLCSVPILTHLHARYLRRSRYVLGLHSVDLLVGVSRSVTDDLVHDGVPPSRVALIPNGIDPVRLTAGDRRGLRDSLAMREGEVLVAVVGSLVRHKGHDIMLEALRRVGKHGPRMQVLFVGDGPERARLAQLADGLPVHFLGNCSDVGAIFRDAVDLLVVPSRQEAFGLVIAESGFFGVPAIGSETGGIPEVIRPGETGLLVPPENPEVLASAIIRLVANPALRRAMGEAARRHVAANFLIGQNVRMIERSYDATLDCHEKLPWTARISLRPYWRLGRSLAGWSPRT